MGDATTKAPTANAATFDQVPPYCYHRPGMSAEEGAAAAIKELGITHLCDAIALLWALRRAAKGTIGPQRKTQQRLIAKACSPFFL